MLNVRRTYTATGRQELGHVRSIRNLGAFEDDIFAPLQSHAGAMESGLRRSFLPQGLCNDSQLRGNSKPFTDARSSPLLRQAVAAPVHRPGQAYGLAWRLLR